MEIKKQSIDQEKIKIEIGVEFNQEHNKVIGQVELDIENQSYFIEVINSIVDGDSKHVIVDMSNVSYIDSSGLWALFEGYKKISEKKKKMILLNPTKDVKRVLEITKMSSKLLLYDNEDEAVQFLTTA